VSSEFVKVNISSLLCAKISSSIWSAQHVCCADDFSLQLEEFIERLGLALSKEGVDTGPDLCNLLEKSSFILDAFDRHKSQVARFLLFWRLVRPRSARRTLACEAARTANSTEYLPYLLREDQGLLSHLALSRIQPFFSPIPNTSPSDPSGETDHGDVQECRDLIPPESPRIWH
jgi:hypothetical protein